jgi:hypothetical protein
VPAGSYLAISRVASDLLESETTDDLTDVTKRMVQQQLISRGREEVARFFAGRLQGSTAPPWRLL